MLDYDLVKSRGPIVSGHDWTKKDTILYALGVGADELDFVYEEGLKPLPTMIGVLAYPGFIWRDPAFGLDWQKIVHAEQEIVRHMPIPVEGRFDGETRVDAVVDKGADRGAIIYHTREIVDGSGNLVATSRAATMARGDGGFDPSGGDAAPWETITLPDAEPDATMTLPSEVTQALVYRLSGDLNPLHIDPEVAKAAGFDRPILHGMCTFGIVGRALLKVVCDNDPDRFHAMRCRFSAPVYPGDSIRTEIWRSEPGVACFQAVAEERGVVVLKTGKFTYKEENA